MTTTQGNIIEIEKNITNAISHSLCNEFDKSFNNEKFIKKVIDTIWKKFEKDIFEITTKEFSELLNPTTNENLKQEYEDYIRNVILNWHQIPINKENMNEWIKQRVKDKLETN